MAEVLLLIYSSRDMIIYFWDQRKKQMEKNMLIIEVLSRRESMMLTLQHLFAKHIMEA